MMPTGDDEESARIRFDGEARRVLIPRPKFDRDGLYLFGRRYAAHTVSLTAAELSALFDGGTLAVDDGEYILYLSVDGANADEVLSARAAVAAAKSKPRYSDRVRTRAAQVRVNADRRARPRVPTPKWIVELARRNPEADH
jgi:hypothetical protein